MNRRTALTVGIVTVALTVAGSPVAAGIGAAGPPAPPVATEVGSSDWRQVDLGALHTCGIRANRRAYCWGADGSGQLGTAGQPTNSPVPAEVTAQVDNWASISAGFTHTCGIRTNGRLFCWGAGGQGQLGSGGPPASSAAPVQVAGNATNWASVSAGNAHTCARKTNGRLFCWGDDSNGRLGTAGPPANSNVPVQVAGNATNWASVSTGNNHTCARKTNGRLFCWGDDAEGQLGTAGPPANSNVPVQVAGNATNWAAVQAGGFFTCGRRTTGRLFCWGADSVGQLGNGAPNASRPTPVPVGTASWRGLGPGDSHGCSVRNDRRLFCWGWDNSSQLGDGGPPNADQPAPVEVAGRATDWASVAGGSFHTCARTTTGRLFCWGADGTGQLGDGTVLAGQHSPAQVVAT